MFIPDQSQVQQQGTSKYWYTFSCDQNIISLATRSSKMLWLLIIACCNGYAFKVKAPQEMNLKRVLKFH
jgi:hypothetical protein